MAFSAHSGLGCRHSSRINKRCFRLQFIADEDNGNLLWWFRGNGSFLSQPHWRWIIHVRAPRAPGAGERASTSRICNFNREREREQKIAMRYNICSYLHPLGSWSKSWSEIMLSISCNINAHRVRMSTNAKNNMKLLIHSAEKGSFSLRLINSSSSFVWKHLFFLFSAIRTQQNDNQSWSKFILKMKNCWQKRIHCLFKKMLRCRHRARCSARSAPRRHNKFILSYELDCVLQTDYLRPVRSCLSATTARSEKRQQMKFPFFNFAKLNESVRRSLSIFSTLF